MIPKLSRRMLLRGAGATVALPLLEAMIPRRASAQAVSPTRACFIKFPLGTHPGTWTTQGTGTNFTVSPELRTLITENKSELCVVKGLHTHLGIHNDVAAGVSDLNYFSFGVSHYQGTAGFLTCKPQTRGPSYPVSIGTSVDQLIAQSPLGTQTRFRSLVLRSVENSAGSDATYGEAKAYRTNISWANPTTPASSIDDPITLFNRLFAGGVPVNPGDPTVGRAGRYDVSVLDAINEDTKRLRNRLGNSDRARLDQYLTSLEEVERQAKAAVMPMQQPMAACTVPAAPSGSFSYPNFCKERMRAMFDLLILAYQCDLTRVASYMIDEDFQPFNTEVLIPNTLTYPHALSHFTTNEGADPALKPAQFREFNQFYFDEFSAFLNKLKLVQTPTGRLIDSMLIAFGASMSNTDSHSGYDAPMILAGRGNGAVTPGRLVDVRTGPYAAIELERPWDSGSTQRAKGRPMADLWLTVMRAMGMNDASFGNSGGVINEMRS
ncbi:MAG: DUF1552 domain-containing protein [Archangium sp.]